MGVSAARPWLVAYDIRDTARLAKVHRVIADSALQVQYSVYLFEGTASALRRLLDAAAREMDLSEDDLRAYPVPRTPVLFMLGCGRAPPGVHVLMGDDALLPLLWGEMADDQIETEATDDLSAAS